MSIDIIFVGRKEECDWEVFIKYFLFFYFFVIII